MIKGQLFSDLSDSRFLRANEAFDQFVLSGQSVVFEKPLASLTRQEFHSCEALRKFWLYWYRAVPVTFGGLNNYLDFHTARIESCETKFKNLIDELWKLAQTSNDEVFALIEKMEYQKSCFKASKAGQQANAIEHLRSAAAILGYEKDHFYRQMRVVSIRKLEGETEGELAVRIQATKAYEQHQMINYPKSQKKKTSVKSYALRCIWPLLFIDVKTLKQLFKTEKMVNRHSAALRSILTLASDDYDIKSGQIDDFLESVE